MFVGRTAFRAAAMFNKNGLQMWGEWKPLGGNWCGACMSISLGGGLGIESNMSIFDFLAVGDMFWLMMLSMEKA